MKRVITLMIIAIMVMVGTTTTCFGATFTQKQAEVEKRFTVAINKGYTDVNLEDINLSSNRLVTSACLSKALYRNPEIWWVSGIGGGTWNPDKNIVCTESLTYWKKGKSLITAKIKFNRKLNKLVRIIRKEPTRLKKINKAYRLLKGIKYRSGYDSEFYRNTYSALINGKANCVGFSKTFKLLMDRVGVPCRYYTSHQIDHVWNKVKYKGKWYSVDVTWNRSNNVKNILETKAHAKKTGHKEFKDLYNLKGKTAVVFLVH